MRFHSTLNLSEDQITKVKRLSFAFRKPMNRIVEAAIADFIAKHYKAIEEAENALKRLDKSLS